MNLAKIEEINRLATEGASIALSKLAGVPVTVKVHSVEFKKVKEVFKILDVETMCIVVRLAVVGEIEGSMGMVFPKESALLLADLLLKRELGTTQELTSEGITALEELGNIVAGRYLESFSKCLGSPTLLQQAPSLAWETFGSIGSGLLAALKPGVEEIPFVVILLGFEETVIKGYVLILFEGELLEKSGGRLKLP